MKKNGFVSTSLIYSLFLLFLLLMIFLLNSYSSIRFLTEQFKYDIKNSFVEASSADINLYVMVWNENTGDYEIQDEVPVIGYEFETSNSSCTKGSTMAYINGNISITASRNDTCYAYFRQAEQDIILRMYIKDRISGRETEIKNIPNANLYQYESGTCNNSGTITFNNNTRKFSITSPGKTECKAYFVRKEMDIMVNLYKEDSTGDYKYNGKLYQEVSTIPGLGYTFVSSLTDCKNDDVDTNIYINESNELIVDSNGRNECNIFYDISPIASTPNGNTPINVELVIMQESDTGSFTGLTTGAKYSPNVTIPTTGYKYVGYKCDDSEGVNITYNNGIFTVKSSVPTTCYAYFNKYSGNVYIDYYLETGFNSNEYENVSSIPSLGYVYNVAKSSCEKNSAILVNNNIVTIEATDEDTCKVYFDMANPDITVNVYVMNRTTKQFELSDVPLAGYELFMSSCNKTGASIEYDNGALKVISEGPAVCTAYFR